MLIRVATNIKNCLKNKPNNEVEEDKNVFSPWMCELWSLSSGCCSSFSLCPGLTTSPWRQRNNNIHGVVAVDLSTHWDQSCCRPVALRSVAQKEVLDVTSASCPLMDTHMPGCWRTPTSMSTLSSEQPSSASEGWQEQRQIQAEASRSWDITNEICERHVRDTWGTRGSINLQEKSQADSMVAWTQ